MALTPKQARFVDEYLLDLNATQAAIRSGYSAHTAKSIGQENLTKPAVAVALAARQLEVAKAHGITLENHLNSLAVLRDAAFEDKQYAAAITAETNRGKVAGLYVDRVEDVTKLSREERRERLLKLVG